MAYCLLATVGHHLVVFDFRAGDEQSRAEWNSEAEIGKVFFYGPLPPPVSKEAKAGRPPAKTPTHTHNPRLKCNEEKERKRERGKETTNCINKKEKKDNGEGN